MVALGRVRAMEIAFELGLQAAWLSLLLVCTLSLPARALPIKPTHRHSKEEEYLPAACHAPLMLSTGRSPDSLKGPLPLEEMVGRSPVLLPLGGCPRHSATSASPSMWLPCLSSPPVSLAVVPAPAAWRHLACWPAGRTGIRSWDLLEEARGVEAQRVAAWRRHWSVRWARCDPHCYVGMPRKAAVEEQSLLLLAEQQRLLLLLLRRRSSTIKKRSKGMSMLKKNRNKLRRQKSLSHHPL